MKDEFFDSVRNGDFCKAKELYDNITGPVEDEFDLLYIASHYGYTDILELLLSKNKCEETISMLFKQLCYEDYLTSDKVNSINFILAFCLKNSIKLKMSIV